MTLPQAVSARPPVATVPEQTDLDEGLSAEEFAAALAAMPASGPFVRRQWRDFRQAARDMLVHQVGMILAFSLLGLLIGLLLSTLVRWVFYGNAGAVPAGAPVAGSGNPVWGSLATLVLTSLIVGVIAYRWQVGRARFRRDLRELPKQVLPLLRRDGRGPALVHMLWGFAASTVVIMVIGTALGAIFAAGAVLSFGTAVRPLVSSLLMAPLRGVGRRVAPQHRWPPSAAAMVSLMGSILAALVALLVQDWTSRLVLALVAAGSAVMISMIRAAGRRPAPPPPHRWVPPGAGH